MSLATRACALLSTLAFIAACGDRPAVDPAGADLSTGRDVGADTTAVLPPDSGTALDTGAPDSVAPDGAALDSVAPDAMLDTVALDSAAPDAAADAAPATNDQCQKAQRVTLTGSKLTLSGNTTGASNQFGTSINCGSSTTFDGPQRYYLIALAAQKTYRVTVTPKGFDVGLYAFSATAGCNATAIDAACQGYSSDGYGEKTETIFIAPIVSQDWALVVDSYSASAAGAYTLEVEEVVAPKNGTCAAPAVLTLTGGKATVAGDTTLSKNEFGSTIACGTSYDFDGAQLYYEVSLLAGKHYQITATSSAFDTALYAFPSKVGCNATAINTACDGHISDLTSGKPDRIIIAPSADSKWTVVVDSDWQSKVGAFTLEVTEVTVPANAVCASPTTLALTGGKASVSGDTSLAIVDEFGSAVECGKSYGFDAPQLYYEVALVAGKTYRVTMDPSGFDGVLYAFASSIGCASSAVSLGCSGNVSDKIGDGAQETLVLSPLADANWVLAVDGYGSSDTGTFSLKVEELIVPTNATCATALAVQLTGGQATLSGDTSLVQNEFGKAIGCGTSYDFDAPQLYYRVSLEAGKTYKIGMTPKGFDGTLYAFPASTACSATAIDAACSAHVAENGGNDKTEILTLSPAAKGDWIVVVDAWYVDDAGTFDLTILQTP